MNNFRNIIISLFFLFLFADLFFAQEKSAPVERDTSFTVYSAALKIAKDFPNAIAVKPFKFSNITEKKNLVYTSYGSRKMHIDLFIPKEKKKHPAVLLVHGGGWRSGDRSMEIPTAQYLASCGYVAATVEYRLSTEALYPAAVSDLKTAVKWLRSRWKKYNIDTSKIAAYGCSAGGQLVALLGATNYSGQFESDGKLKKYSSALQAVINVDGVLTFDTPAERAKDEDPKKPSAARLWFGYSFKEKPELWIDASALTHVNQNSPPIIFINSALERYHGGRDEFIQKLNSYNIYSEVHTIPNTPHPFWLFHPWFDESIGYIKSFLDKTFKK